METKTAQELMRPILDQLKRETFNPGYQATDAQALGILVSKFFEWDGSEVLAAAFSGLEDSNYHKEAAVLNRMINGVYNFPRLRSDFTGWTWSAFGYSLEIARTCGRLSEVALSKGPRTLWRLEKGE